MAKKTFRVTVSINEEVTVDSHDDEGNPRTVDDMAQEAMDVVDGMTFGKIPFEAEEI